jgi:hypothetical protein
MYSLSTKQVVPLHVLCGEWQEILSSDGTRFCVVVGNKEKAQEVVDELNAQFKRTFVESPDYDPSQSPIKE